MAIPVGPVVYAIEVNGQLINDIPLDVELRQAWGTHDLFFIRIEYSRTTSLVKLPIWAENAPVKITWGRRPTDIQIWYGYVNHYNHSSNADSGSKATQITYICIGTSKPMNTDQTYAWGQVTGTYIAKTLATKYKMRSVLTTSNWVLPSETQANESDFKFLNRIADKIGYRTWISGGTLYFIDPAVVISGSSNQAVPNFVLDKRFTDVDTVRDFSMNSGDNLPGATKAVRSIYGVDQASGTVFQIQASNAKANSTSAIQQNITSWPVNNITQAQQLVNAAQNRSQFWSSATAELFGNSYIYPGKMVYLTGNQMPIAGTGYWIIGSATHVLKTSGTTLTTSDKFVTRVELLRNSANPIPTLTGTHVIKPEFVNCQLLQGVWQSTDMSIIYDGVSS